MTAARETLHASLNRLRQSTRVSSPLREAVDRVELAIAEARACLDEVLWDDEPWSPEDLVKRMEQVYEMLGGSLDGPRAASPAGENTP